MEVVMEFNATIVSQVLKKDAEKDAEEKFEQILPKGREDLWKKGKRHNAGMCLAFCAFLAVFILFIMAFSVEDDSDWIVLGVLYALLALGCIIAEIVILSAKYNDKTAKDAFYRDILKKWQGRVLEPEEENFKIEQKVPFCIERGVNPYLFIDNERRKFIIQAMSMRTKTYRFEDILDFEIYENNNSVVKGTAGKTLIGGTFFGLTGALVGGNMSRGIKTTCNTLYLIIRVKDIEDPHLVISYVKDGNIDKNTDAYKKMQQNLQEVCSFLEYMAKGVEEKQNESKEETKTQTNSKKAQLQELKELLDDGLINQEEFEEKKRRILDL